MDWRKCGQFLRTVTFVEGGAAFFSRKFITESVTTTLPMYVPLSIPRLIMNMDNRDNVN